MMLRALLAAAALAVATPAAAFCGFYVAKADADLFNDASKVVLVRDGERTVLTMVNDYIGEPTEFAMVVPTPQVLEREQVHVTENRIIDHLDAYTAPRLVEYFDEDPCAPQVFPMAAAPSGGASSPVDMVAREQAEALGVTIERQYTVGEYDILILSATQSDGLQTWLDQNGYKTPEKARAVLASYLAQGMKFFVAKVNLEERAKLGGEMLRPLQLAFESPKFMLPIRLGTVNARGPQDLVLFTLTRTGRVETSNYRTIRIPSDVELPLFIQKEFDTVYPAIFERTLAKAGGPVTVTEYAWDMSWCDPCAADPLPVADLRELGAYWLAGGADQGDGFGQPIDAFVTRLHIRYDAAGYPDDLRLHETGDRENFQGRYVTRQPFRGASSCAAADVYRRELSQRWEREAQTLASLTGWEIETIRAKMTAGGQSLEALPPQAPWWQSIWK